MRISLSTWLFLGLFVGSSPAFAADDEPQEIVARSIKAHGGEAKLNRRAYCLALKGRLYAAGKVIDPSGSTKADGPTRARIFIKIPAGETVLVVDGDKGWIREGDATRLMSDTELAEAKEDLHTDWVTTLGPLLEKEVTLSLLASEKVAGSAAVGVHVSQKGFRDVDLFFDRETWLLVKKSITRPGADGKELVYETLFGGYKVFDGV